MTGIIGIVLTLALVASTAYAAEEKKPTPQQEKMRACNAQATEKALKGTSARPS